MSLILGIETATSVCSVALADGDKILSVIESANANDHSTTLTAYIQQVMKESGKNLEDMDAVAVSIGPGSYTGLRIGLSSAKGLCYALDKPLIAIDTLQGIAWQALALITENADNALISPMIDARRMEVYTTLYTPALELAGTVKATVVDEGFYEEFDSRQIYLVGNGAGKCKEILKGKSYFRFLDIEKTSAIAVCALAQVKFRQADFVNTAYCEPFYLKDFVAGKPTVKGLYD